MNSLVSKKKKKLSIWLIVISCLFLSTQVLAETFTVPGDASPERCDNGVGTRFSWKDYAEKKGLELAPVRDQKSCGCCWAFPAVGVMEDILALNNINTRLSREILIGDCGCNGDCKGGFLKSALIYLSSYGTYDVGGADHLYYSSGECMVNDKCSHKCKCGFNWLHPLFPSCSGSCDDYCNSFSGFNHYDIEYGKLKLNNKKLKLSLIKYGPLMVIYKTFNHPHHDMEIVGYDDYNKICLEHYGKSKSGCWILKNSWGDISGLFFDKTIYHKHGYAYVPYSDPISINFLKHSVYYIKGVEKILEPPPPCPGCWLE